MSLYPIRVCPCASASHSLSPSPLSRIRHADALADISVPRLLGCLTESSLATSRQKWYHAQCEVIIITVYEPDTDRWIGFRRRIKP